MKVASYFSGIGGLDLGLDRAGFKIISQCEKDEYRREVLNERFPGAKIYEDIREVHHGDPVDLICGGFPCQDLSVAGKRAGLDGERSGLFFEFARIAEESVKDGGFVLIENVPGLFSSNEGEDFRIVLETLYEYGFNDLAWRTLNSQYFGVPQRRRRVFILGRRSRGTSCAQILLEPESGEGNYQKNNQEKKENTLASITGLGTGGPDDNDAQNGRLIAGPLTSRYGKGINSTMDDGAAIIAFHHKQDPIHSEEIYPAIGTTTVGMGISGPKIGVRRLTPIECERLQGLPDDWTQLGNTSDNKRYAAIGDAVTVPVAKWVGERILKYA